MTRKLQAREDFEKGDAGCATGNKVSKPTQSGRPLGSVLVTALQDVKAGKRVGLKSNDDSSHVRAPTQRSYLCAAFAWFRLEHLRDLERFR
jgi:hypothetical protein